MCAVWCITAIKYSCKRQMEINIGENTHNWCRANANMENHYALFLVSGSSGVNIIFMTPASSTV